MGRFSGESGRGFKIFCARYCIRTPLFEILDPPLTKMAEAAIAGDNEVQQTSIQAVSFSVGDSFESFDALQTKIKAYEQAHCVQFWRRDSRTIEAAKKRLDRIAP